MNAANSHEGAVAAMLKSDPEFAAVYLAAALDEAELPGGKFALRTVLRQVVEAQGIASVAARAGVPMEDLRLELSPRGAPRLKTLLALLKALGMRLAVQPLQNGYSSVADEPR
jgi:probable addiction module antidote protein